MKRALGFFVKRASGSRGFAALLMAALLPTLIPMTSFGNVGMWKQYVIIDTGSGNSYYGDSPSANFNGQNFGTFYLGDRFFLNGAEGNSWEDSGDWAGPFWFYYRLANSGGFTQITLSQQSQNGNNRMWDKTAENILLTSGSTGTRYIQVYFEVQGNWSGGNWLAASDGSSGSPHSATYTLNALNTPSGQSANRNSGNPQSAIDLAWTKGTSGSAKDTLIVRSTTSNFTAPTQGSTYNSGNTLGSGTVIYRGGATSLTDSGLTADTVYYYAFYSENYSYYSAAVTANTRTRPTDATWDGGGADNNSLTEANWNNDLYPWAGSGSIMRFAGSTRTTPSITHTANSDFGSIYFNSGASAFTISGNALNINSLIQNDSSNLQTISNNLALADNTTANAASGDMALGGVLSGSKTLTKSGGHELTLSGNNTFSGGVSQNASGGTLNINHNNALGSGTYTIASGNTFDNTSGGAVTIPNNVAINAATTFGGSNPLVVQGTVNLGGANRTLTVTSGLLTLDGQVTQSSGDRVLTKAGAGTLTLNGNNDHGGVTITGGLLNIGHANALGTGTFTPGANTFDNTSGGALTVANAVSLNGNSTFVGTDSLEVGGAVTLTGNRDLTVTANELELSGAVGGAYTLTKEGAGTLTLSGNNSGLGAVTVSGGRLNVNNANALGSGTFTPGANTFGNTSGGAVTVANEIDGNANFTFAGPDSLTFNGAAAGTWSGARTYQIDAGTLTINGVIGENAGGRSLVKNGNGTLVFSGQNTYSGPARINAGTFIYTGTNTSSDVGVGSAAFFYGNGSIGGLIVTGQVSAGSASNTIADLRVTSLDVKNNSQMQVDFSAMTGTAGTDWDLITASGDAKITANSVNPLVLLLKGNPSFDNTKGYTNVLVSAGTVTSFAANRFVVNTDEFSPNLGAGSFEVQQIGNDVCLVFIPGASEPTVQAKDIVFSSITASSITLNWTSGNGANRLVVAHAGAAVDANPSDNASYTADNTFGDGDEIGTGNFVVYGGSGSSVTVNGLSAGTTYHFRIYEFTGTGGSEDYLTSTATDNPASQSTLAAEPATQATTVIFTSLDTTSMTVGWTSGSGANRLVIVRQGSAPSGGPVDGTSYTADGDFSGGGDALGDGKVVYIGSGNSFSLSGLTAATLYYAQVFEFDGSGATVNYKTDSASGNPGNRYTLSAAPAGHVSSFTATVASDSQIDLAWTAASGPPSGYIILQRTGDDPSGTPSDGTGYTVGNTIGDGTVAAIVTPGSATSTNITGLSGGTEYHFSIIPFNWDGSQTQTYNYYTDATIPTAYDTTFPAEPGTQASSITLSSRTKDSLSIAWTSGNGANRIVVAHEGAAVDSNPADGSGYSADAVFGSGAQIGTGNYVVYSGSGNSVAVTGLKTNTTYHFRVYEFNGSSGTANYNVTTPSGNPNNFSTADNEPGLGVGGPISVSTTVGSNPASGSFVVTNIGGSVLSYEISDDVGWLSVSATTATNKSGGQTESHTITYDVTGLSVGVSNATITVTQTGADENAATNSPQTITVQLTLNAITDPTAVSVSGDGSELVRLAWTKSGGYDVMIVYDTSAIATEPTPGTPYSVGDFIGSGKVIYKGGDETLEHVVPIGSSVYYKFYSVNNNYYSDGVTGNDSLPSYLAGEIVESFAYTSQVSLASLNGGQGWASGWTVNSGTYGIRPSLTSNNMSSMVGYPASSANKVRMSDPGNGGSASAARSLPTINAGTVYVASMISYEYRGTSKWAGISFASNGVERAFFGKLYASTNRFGLDSHGNSAVTSAFEMNPFSGSVGDTNNVYLIVARYNFSTRVMDAKAFYRTTAVPEAEPSSWDVTDTLPVGRMNSFDGIRLTAGSGAGDATIGRVDYDEIRVATNWADLVQADKSAPVALAYSVNGGSPVTDAQITGGTYRVTVDLWNIGGVESVSTSDPYFQPNFDVLTPGSVQLVTDYVFSSFIYTDAGKTLLASNTAHTALDSHNDVVLGVYTVRWSAVSSNGTSAIDITSLSNSTPQEFTVVDDDTATPEPANILSTNSGGGSARLLHIALGSANLSANGAATNNILYTVTDGALTSLSAGNPLIFWLGARDSSGLNRGNSDAATNSTLSIGSAIIDNVAQYDASRSDPFASTMNARATNVWSWISPFSSAEIENLVTNTAASGSNAVVATWRDADADRPNDFMTLVHTQGWLAVTDDDTVAPVVQNVGIYGSVGSYTVRVDELVYGTGWAITGRVSDSTSGINVNGSNTTQPNASPYFELWDPSGTMKLREAFDTLSFAHGGANTLSPIGHFSPSTMGSAQTGTWTARVIVADADTDWAGDRLFTTNEVPFVVIPGDFAGGIGRAPASYAVTSSYGIVTSTDPWPNVYVTNIGSGTLTYSNSISYASAGGWLGISPPTGMLVGNGSAASHTLSVDASALSPGVYQATLTFDGDQTNAAQSVNITLYVAGYFAGEIVDQFTNSSGSLHGSAGGTGWTDAWDDQSGGGGFSFSSGNLQVPANYPAAKDNRICGDSSSDNELKAFRYFSPFSTGSIYVAVAVQKSDGNSDGFNGISLMDDGAEVAFAGKLYNNEKFGVEFGSGNGGPLATDFGVNGGSAYMYLARYDFETGLLYGRAYNGSDTLPLVEPNWRVTNAPITAISQVNGIRIAAKNEGNVCFDEVRVSATWEGLLNQFSGEPTMHASAMSFRDVTTNSMVVGWTPGNGGSRIVVAREGAAVSWTPDDSNTYSFDSDFSTATDLGSGNKVVYNGSGTNFTFTGLDIATRYYFAVYEYNGAGANANYYTNSGFATGNRWTLVAEPENPIVTFDAYPASETTITNKWTLPGGSPAPDGYLILRRQGSAVVDSPVDGVAYTNDQVLPDARVALVTSGSATEFLQSNMNSCITYYFKIFPFRWNGSDAETYNYLTNSAAVASAETQCESPAVQASNIVFTLTATNRIGISWQRGSGQGAVVLVHASNPVDSHPVDGATYTANATFGSGSQIGTGNYVVYGGTGTTVTVDGLTPGTVYHFRVYEYNGSGAGIDYNVDTAVNNPRSTATASFGLVEDKFVWNYFGDYANNNLSGAGTGTGWTNSWSTYGGYVAVDDANSPAFKGYPADPRSGCGNNCDDSRQIKISTVSGTSYGASRGFPARTSGKVFFAAKINIQNTPKDGWAGISFMNGSSEVAFLGKGYDIENGLLTLDDLSGHVTTTPLQTNTTWTLNGGSPYLLVLEYDFDAKVLAGRAYTPDNLPHADPDLELAWNVMLTNVTISSIDGIRFGGRNVGELIIDHIRIAPSWEEVLWGLPANWHEDNGPVPTLVYIGTNYRSEVYSQVITNLSDAELNSSQLIDFAVRWDSPSGVYVENTGTNFIGSTGGRITPNWDPLAVGVASNEFGLDRFFTNFFGVNGATSVTTYQRKGFSVTNLDFELQYFVTVSAETDPGGSTVSAPGGGDAVPVNRALTVNEPLRFYVYDDDTNAPLQGSRPLRVMTNANPASAQSVGNALERYFVYDGMLPETGMRVSLGAYDEYSGLQRSDTGTADTNMTVTIPFVTTNDNANYKAALSSDHAATMTAGATSVWEFAANLFTYERISAMWGGDGSAPQGDDIEITANLVDADVDRIDDQLWSSNHVMGYIRLLDDDEVSPQTTNVVFTGAAGRPFFANTNGFAIGSGDTLIRNVYSRRQGTSSNTIFAVTDEELAKAGDRHLQFAFGAIDKESGVLRGTSGTTNDIMSFSIGGDILSGVVSGWSAGLSTSGNGPGVVQTNIWSFSNGTFSESVITQLMAVTGSSGSSQAVVRVTIPDSDNDRVNDTATLYSEQVGFLQVFDDDIAGPQIASASVLGSEGGGILLSTSFETNQAWPSSLPNATAWTNTDAYGSWVGVGVIQTSLDPKHSGTRRIGLLTNNVPEVPPYIQLPPIDAPGLLSVYASRVTGGSGDPILRLEWRDGNTWVSLGDVTVTGVNTNWQQISWSVELYDPGVTMRIVRVENGEYRSQVYLDDLSVNGNPEWISTNALTFTWTEAVDDYSGINYYKVVAPSLTAPAPTTTNDGVWVSASVTSGVADITGVQGVITGYLFSVDNDDDRSHDNTMGNVVPLLARVDTNPPLAVLDVTNDVSDLTVDETSELKITWTPASTNMHQAAGWRQADSEPLSPWETYVVFVYELDGNDDPISTNVLTYTNGPANLDEFDTGSIILSNLNFDTYHRISIAGRDRAGNLGPMVTVTGLTVNFQVTQGWARTTAEYTNAVRLAWIAANDRVYDELYVDAASMTDSMSNHWDWMDRVTNNYAEGNTLFDAGGNNPTNRYRVAPGELSGPTMRFYRVSQKDTWRPEQGTRRASREIYVTKPLRLKAGENWYSTFFIPDTATVSYVFGTNRLPSGSDYATATKIHWFAPEVWRQDLYDYTSNTVGLVNGSWQKWDGGAGDWDGPANDMILPLQEGFMIELPPGSPDINLPVVGLVSTQEVVMTIPGRPGTQDVSYVRSWGYPYRAKLADLNLIGSGMTKPPVDSLYRFADELRVLRNNGKGTFEEPAARWYISASSTWKLVPNGYNTNVYPTAPTPATFVIEPDDAIIFIRRSSDPIYWTNKLYYTPPGKSFDP